MPESTKALPASTMAIAKARQLVEWTVKALYDLELPGTRRTRIAATCFGVAQEHHHAIVVLLETNLKSSAFALVRAVYEAYVRGLWLAHCANDAELETFSTGVEPPKMDTMLSAIECTGVFAGGELSQIKTQNWRSMCDYAHSGSRQVQRWNTSDIITPNHSVEEIDEILGFTNTLMLLSAVSVAALANNEVLARTLLEKSREYTV